LKRQTDEQTNSFIPANAGKGICLLSADNSDYLYIRRQISYWQGWLFCGIYFIFLIHTSFNFAGKKDLLAKRLKPGPASNGGTKYFSGSIYFSSLPFL